MSARTLRCCPYCESKQLEAFDSGPAFVGRCLACGALFKTELIAREGALPEAPRSSYEQWPPRPLKR